MLFFAYTGPADSSRVEAYDLKTRRRTVLIPRASNPRFVTGGFLTFIRNGALLAVRFDEKRLRIEGDPMPVLSDVAFDVSNGSAAYAVSTQGTLAYVRQSDADAPQLLREVGRDGRDGELLTTKGKWAEPRLSPDGRYLAATLRSSPWQIWLLDRSRRVLSQLTRSAGASFSPNWAPDGKSLVHVAETPVYDVVRTLLDGSSVDTLSRTSRDKFATSVGPDGRTFAFSQLLEHDDVFVQTGRDAPRAIMTGPDARQGATISPDGRWIAYVERSAGRRAEVYVQSLTSASRRQVSSEGGDQPRWTKQGGELVYRRGDAMLSATFDPVTGEPSRPIELFRRLMAGQMSDGRTTGFDVSADGLRFYIVEPQQPERRATVALIFNWRRDLERALPR